MIYGLATGQVGAMVDPDVIDRHRIDADSLYRVVASMEAPDIERFECDLRAYDKTGEKSEFLLGVLALAAGRSMERNRRATVFDIQTDVIGMSFYLPEERAKAS